MKQICQNGINSIGVLIDTWWNVNMIILVVPVSASGF